MFSMRTLWILGVTLLCAAVAGAGTETMIARLSKTRTNAEFLKLIAR